MDAGDQRLLRHAFFERPDLNVLQVASRQADVDPTVLDRRCAGGGLQTIEFSLGRDGLELARLIGFDDDSGGSL